MMRVSKKLKQGALVKLKWFECLIDQWKIAIRTNMKLGCSSVGAAVSTKITRCALAPLIGLGWFLGLGGYTLDEDLSLAPTPNWSLASLAKEVPILTNCR